MQVGVFDPAVEPSADGSTGLWWREERAPVVTGHTVDFILARWASGPTVPDGPLPGGMMADGEPAWIGMLRLNRGRGDLTFRLAAQIPYDAEEGRSFQHPGPQFTDAAEAALRLVIRYRTHVVTIAPPVAQMDPYRLSVPADQAAAWSAMLAAMDADQAASTVQAAGVALLNAAAGAGVDVSDPAAPTLYAMGAAEIDRALAPQDVMLLALEITHPAITTPARMVSDTVEHVIEGNRYVAVPFELTLQDDVEGRVPKASVQIENVGRALTEWLERSEGGAGAKCRIMRVLARDDSVAYEITIGVEGMHVDAQWVQATLGYGSILSIPAVQMRYDSESFPGLY